MGKNKDVEERRDLTSIQDKLLNERGSYPTFVAHIYINYLMDFNRSISWCDCLEDDDKITYLLLAEQFDNTPKLFMDI